eukprot:scaffold21781_cov83-Isochrysis_galbana.AAC.3
MVELQPKDLDTVRPSYFLLQGGQATGGRHDSSRVLSSSPPPLATGCRSHSSAISLSQPRRCSTLRSPLSRLSMPARPCPSLQHKHKHKPATRPALAPPVVNCKSVDWPHWQEAMDKEIEGLRRSGIGSLLGKKN